MTDFPTALPHGPIREEFPGIFLVTGSFAFGPGLRITRNMTIVRQGDDLIIVNSVRLSPKGEAQLEKLGKVKHVLRIGAFHGADDPYFKERFGATLWAPPGTTYESGTAIDEELRPGHCPIEGAQVFAFEKGKRPEVALLLEREGGILVTCDCYQNWTTFEGCSLLGKLMMRAMGFGPTIIGGPWVKSMGPDVREDFDRLLELPFVSLIPAHGTVLERAAKAGLATAMASRFTKSHQKAP
jgi:hypothetical protein